MAISKLESLGVPVIIKVFVKVSVDPDCASASERVSPQIHVAPGMLAVHALLIGVTATEAWLSCCVVVSLTTVFTFGVHSVVAAAEVTAGKAPITVECDHGKHYERRKYFLHKLLIY